MLKLPRSLSLPFGYKAKVRVVSRAQLDQVGGSGCDGLWRIELMTIYILRDLGSADRIDKYLHEAGHMFRDWELFIRQRIGLSS